MQPPAPESLAELAGKYRELCALRQEAAHGNAEPPRARLASLAGRFPGALRELDRLPLEVLQGRLSALDTAAAGRAPAPPWAALQLAYHGWLRALLRLKRVLPRGVPLAQLPAALAAVYQPGADEPPLARIDAATLEALRAPPAGRLSQWALARAAEQHGVEPADVERALLGIDP